MVTADSSRTRMAGPRRITTSITARRVTIPFQQASLLAMRRVMTAAGKVSTLLVATRDRVLYHSVAPSIPCQDFGFGDPSPGAGEQGFTPG